MVSQFHAVRSALTEWFEARAPRERMLLLAGGSVALAAFAYNVLWEPAYSGRASIAANLPLLQSQLADMRGELGEVRSLRTAVAVHLAQGTTLRDTMAASLVQAGIANAHVTALGTNSVQIDAKAVPFAAWMTWLDQARHEWRVRVVNAHASAETHAGLATVSATLEPASQ